MGIKRDLKNNLDVVQSLEPKARVATANGSSADLLGYGAAMVVFSFGLYTNGTFVPKVQESDDDSGWSDVAAADLEGSLTNVDHTDDDLVSQRVGYKGTKRYIRARLEEETSPDPGTGCVAAALIIRGHADGAPLA